MEELNHTIFEAINATEQSHPFLLGFGEFAAVYLISLVPLVLVVGWLAGGDRIRRAFTETFFVVAVVLAISTVIGWLWPQPRPFVVPIGNTFIDYDATPAFPSNHAAIMLAVSCTFLLNAVTRRLGAVFLALTVAVGWARVYLGVHFPLDMLGAVVLSVTVAAAVAHWRDVLIAPVYEGVVQPLFRWLFAPAIRRGWIEE